MAKKTRTPRTPSGESKADKFKRIAAARVTKAVKMIDNLSKCGGSGYERTPEQVKKIETVLLDSVKRAVASLAPRVAGEKKEEGPVIQL